MKQFKLLLILVLITNIVKAQCIIAPVCTNSITINGNNLQNQSVNSDVCITGSGIIPNSFNWNNWNNLTFNGSIISNQDINFQNEAKRTFNYGNINYLTNTSMDGQDTISVETNSALFINNLIANNFPNIIILKSNASLIVKYQGVNTNFFPGDTIKTVLGNNSNNVLVLACNNIPLKTTILEFVLYHNFLRWTVESNSTIEVQYSEDGIHFASNYLTSSQTDYTEIKESGFYRLKVGEIYSRIISYNMITLKKSKDSLYYYNSKFSSSPFPNATYTGIKYKN